MFQHLLVECVLAKGLRSKSTMTWRVGCNNVVGAGLKPAPTTKPYSFTTLNTFPSTFKKYMPFDKHEISIVVSGDNFDNWDMNTT